MAVGAHAEEEEQPLVFDGRSAITVPPNPAFDAGSEGTVDVWMATSWTESPGYDPGLVAVRSPAPEGGSAAAATRFSVHIAAARDRIGFWNGRSWGWLPFDFSDGEYHHVALATKGASTEVVVDGRALGAVPLGFGPGRGLPLQVGSADGATEPFIGAVLSLRLWSASLSTEQIARVSELAGPPGAKDPLGKSLVAWAEFTAADQEVHLVGTAAGGSPSPTAQAAEKPRPAAAAPPAEPPTIAPEFDLAGVWVKQNTRVFEKQKVEGVADEDHGRYRTYSVYTLEARDPVVVDLATASFGPGGGKPFEEDLPAGGQVAE